MPCHSPPVPHLPLALRTAQVERNKRKLMELMGPLAAAVQGAAPREGPPAKQQATGKHA